MTQNKIQPSVTSLHLAMPGPWFLLLVFIQGGSLMIEEVSTIDVWDESPSCDELRTLWNTISRSWKTSELNNEIPVVPYWDITSNSLKGHLHRNMEKAMRKQVRYPENHLLTNAIQGPFMGEGPTSSNPQPPVEPLFVLSSQRKTPHRDDVPIGHFGDFSDDRSAAEEDFFLNLPSAVVTPLDTRKKGGGESVLSESWGLPEEVGMFGKFVDFDTEYLHAGDRQSPAHFGSPSLDVHQEPCFEVLNKDCTINEQCLCNGWHALQCFQGKCHSQQLKTENEHGSWHDGPLPHSKLGRQKRPRRNRESTFM